MIKIITAWGDITPPSFGRIAKILRSSQNLPEPICAPTLAEIETVVEDRRSFVLKSLNRESLAHELAEDQESRGAPANTVAATQALAHPDTYLVVTGQQPGLLLGPLYTLAKCLQTVNLARLLTQQGFGTVLPAFWNASEDHDHSEVDHAVWLDSGRQPVRYEADLHGLPENLTVSGIPKERARLQYIIAQLRQSLDGQPHVDFVLDWISQSYSKARFSLADWFDQLLWALLPESGLLILRPESRYLRVQAQSILRREIQDPSLSSIEVNQAGEYLKELGLSQQIHKSESRSSFFLVDQDRRILLTFKNGRFVLPDGRAREPEDLLRQLEERPETFSSSAILRPVIQDACLPTVASILGPNEVLYHLQLNELYSRHGIPRPALVPRVGATFLESKDLKTMMKMGFLPSDFERETKSLVRDVIRRRGAGDSAQLRDELKNQVESTYKKFADLGGAIDPTVVPAIQKQGRQLLKTIDQTEALLVRRQADREELLHRQIDAVSRGLFPLGQPQERVLGVVHFLARHGPDLPDRLGSAFDQLEPGRQGLFALS
ncbi:MAG: bacillithiol biosynthesis cysteine-adding enzyme BshC [bacterium]